MPRTINVWRIYAMIRVLKAHKFSSSEIEDAMKSDLELRQIESGEIIEPVGDRGLLIDAFERPLDSAPDEKIFKKSTGHFDWRKFKKGKGDGKK